MILCAAKCGRRAREVKVQRGGSCLLLSFLCHHLPQCWKERSHVKWFTDSQVAANIVEVGSIKLGLHKKARRLFDICIRSEIHLEVQWIPRTLNQQADYISRLIDTDAWQITDEFLSLDGLWGPLSVDCFANYCNHKLPKYLSRFWNRNSSGVNFLFQSLQEENCLVVPPVGIIPRVLHYLKSQQAVGTLVVPLWPSAHFWPLIAHKYSPYLVAHILHIGNEVLTLGRNFNSLLGSDLFHRKYYCL